MILIDSFKFAASGGGGPAPALVQSRSVYPGSSLAFLSNVTAGNLIVVFRQDYQISTNDLTVTDSLGNTYAKILGWVGNGNCNSWLYYAKNITGGACTIDIAQAASDPGLHIAEISGLDQSVPLGPNASGTGSGTACSTADLVITDTSGIIYAGFGQENNVGAISPGAGFTIDTSETGHNSATEYQVLSSSGTYPVAGTTQTGDWVMLAAFFKAA